MAKSGKRPSVLLVVAVLLVIGTLRLTEGDLASSDQPNQALTDAGDSNAIASAGSDQLYVPSSESVDTAYENSEIAGSWVLTNCLAVQIITRELQISFARLKGDLALLMVTPHIRFHRRNDAVIGLAVDGQRWSVNAYSDPGGSAGSMVVIPLVDSAIRSALRTGNQARISVGDGWTDFSLSGSARSMSYVEECIA